MLDVGRWTLGVRLSRENANVEHPTPNAHRRTKAWGRRSGARLGAAAGGAGRGGGPAAVRTSRRGKSRQQRRVPFDDLDEPQVAAAHAPGETAEAASSSTRET